ncbi:MAG: hypothetical protein COB39_02100 [Marinosulfonomonas sp.]|nr:MAG: hypothetical protein COB39_02100 [Marinosulfonomonas sp.]
MTKPHSIIFCDIDGCLNAGKHVALDLDALGHIRAQISTLADLGVMFSLCTGRPQPYAEAMAQILDVQTPFVCEHGAMVFDPKTEQVFPMPEKRDLQVMADLRRHLQTIVGQENTHTFEPGNEFGLCLTGPGIIEKSYAEISAIKDDYQARCSTYDVIWAPSNCAVDISPKGISKQTGAAWLLERFGAAKYTTYAIGDSAGDFAVLSFVDHAMCPENAAPEVKKMCPTIAKSPTAMGVVEILDAILEEQGR